MCVCVCGLRGAEQCCEKLGLRHGKPEKRQNVSMHLRASGDKKGSSGFSLAS